MALYSYLKKKPSTKSKIVKYFSLTSIIVGIAIIVSILYPIVSFDVVYGYKFVNIVTPLPNDSPVQIRTQGLSHSYLKDNLNLRTDSTNFYTSFNSKIDYTKARFWFPKARVERLPSSTTDYLLDIPKFGIFAAKVKVGGDDLTKSLIHFTGPLPGNYGNPTIFGHSTIPFLYNPSDYKTIFSKLPDFEKGDDIWVKVNNITYQYKVYDMKVVSPDNLEVFKQDFNSPYITLITCVPLGTYRDRLVVRARLEKI